jgi:hypothetical protein
LVFNARPFEGFDPADASSDSPIVRMDINLEILYELPPPIVGGGVKDRDTPYDWTMKKFT